MLRKLLSTLAALLVASAVYAQQDTIPLASAYDLTGTSYTYCVTLGSDGTVWGSQRQINVPVTTSGSSTTVAAVTASSGPFSFVGVGDVLYFNVSGATPGGTVTPPGMTTRTVTAKASADSITVDAAIDLSVATTVGGTAGVPFSFRKLSCGTAATSGWIPTLGIKSWTISYEITTMNAASYDVEIECRPDQRIFTYGILLGPYNYVAAGTAKLYTSEVPCAYIRLGQKLTTDSGVQSIQANLMVVREKQR